MKKLLLPGFILILLAPLYASVSLGPVQSDAGTESRSLRISGHEKGDTDFSLITTDPLITADSYSGTVRAPEYADVHLQFPPELRESGAVLLFLGEEGVPLRIPLNAEPGAVPVETGRTEVNYPAFFFPEGCTHCRQWISEWEAVYPEAGLNLYSIYQQIPFELLSRLEEERGIKIREVPALFTETGVYQGFDELDRYLTEGDFETVTGAVPVMSILTLAGAGFMDGINPCAMATLLFLIALLTMNGASRRQALTAGISFIGSVFISYFLIGLGLMTALRTLETGTVIFRIISWIFALVLAVLAALSLRDALLAGKGRYNDMTLQLGAERKKKIHSFLKKGMASPVMPLSVFLLGMLISLYELGCTGQIYLPSLMYMLRQRASLKAVSGLLIYNLSFIVPLTAVFLLFLGGKQSRELNRLFSGHLVLVKTATAVLFMVLAVLIVIV